MKILALFLILLLPVSFVQSCTHECGLVCYGLGGYSSAVCENNKNQCNCVCNTPGTNAQTYKLYSIECPCFSSHATADVKGKGNVQMSELKVGDQVLTRTGNYETIYSIDHRHPTKLAIFKQIYLSDEAPLELTDMHMLFLDGKPDPVPARTVKVGDQVQTVDGPRRVTKVSSVEREGLFNPLTSDGTIVVNGIVSSTYSAFLSNHEWIEIAGHKVITHQRFFDKLLKPYRYMCTGISLEFCKTNNERVAVSQIALDTYHSWLRRNEMLQVVFLSLAIIFVFLLDFVFSPYSIMLTTIMFGWWIVAKSKNALKQD